MRGRFDVKILLATDIDGTLMKTSEGLGLRLIEAAKQFQRSRNKLMLVSGRSVKATRGIAEQLALRSPCILCGGPLVYDFTSNRILHIQYFDNSIYESLGDILDLYSDISVTVYNENECWSFSTNFVLQESGVKEDKEAPLVSFSNFPQIPLIKVLFTCSQRDTLESIRGLLSSAGFFCHFASRHFLECSPPGCDKGTILKKYVLSLAPQHYYVCVAGDSFTDLTMKACSDVFFAPATAMEQVKQNADYIYRTVSGNGFCEVFDYLNSIRDCSHSQLTGTH